MKSLSLTPHKTKNYETGYLPTCAPQKDKVLSPGTIARSYTNLVDGVYVAATQIKERRIQQQQVAEQERLRQVEQLKQQQTAVERSKQEELERQQQAQLET